MIWDIQECQRNDYILFSMSSMRLNEASKEKTSLNLNFWNFEESSLKLHSAAHEYEKKSSYWNLK